MGSGRTGDIGRPIDFLESTGGDTGVSGDGGSSGDGVTNGDAACRDGEALLLLRSLYGSTRQALCAGAVPNAAERAKKQQMTRTAGLRYGRTASKASAEQ